MELGYTNISKIYGFDPLVLEKIKGQNVFEYAFLTKGFKKAILGKIVTALQELHHLTSAVAASSEDCENNYVTKTFDRLATVQDLLPFAKDEYVTINGKKCTNIFFVKDKIIKEIRQMYPSEFHLIHGDCTFHNMMIETEGVRPVLIDPRGYFGKTKFYGDVDYDWAKLYYSVVGDYDQFNRKNFSLEIKDDSVELMIVSNNWKELEADFFEMTGADKKKIKLLHAIIWLSLTTYAWEDYDAIAHFTRVCLSYRSIWKMTELTLSPLPHTWIFDVDGTICVHNGYKNGGDLLLDGVKDLFAKIPDDDMIILLTSRKEQEHERLDLFMKENGLRYNQVIFDAPMGERILINDDKPSGLKCAYAVGKKRDAKLDVTLKLDQNL